MKNKVLHYPLNFPLVILFFLFSSCTREVFYKKEQKKLESLMALSNGESQIPDFSYAGFERNEKTIPELPVMVTVQPGDGDDGARIQAAINKVAMLPLVNGYKGAVLLKAGTYQVEKPINITSSGVVLRGEGQSETGTIIIATTKSANINKFVLVNITGTGDGFLETDGYMEVNADAAVGSKKIPVSSSSGYKAGDSILLVKTPNQSWLNTIGMTQYGWVPGNYKIPHLRVIERVDPNAVWVDIPLVDGINKSYGGGYITKTSAPGRIYHSGVENINFKSGYDSDVDENHAWTAIQLSRATNCWVKNVTAQYFAFSCVGLYKQSDFNTIQDCAMLDPKSLPLGDRRYSFHIDNGMGNLFQRCFTRGGRHDFVTGARVAGPNVFLDCMATETLDDTGPHHRWATGILFDNVSGGIMHAVNRKDAGTGQGWTGAQVIYWNSTASIELTVSSPPTALNWAIGCKGRLLLGNGEYISRGIPVNPRSLFLTQLEKRLGNGAVLNVTNDAQRNGSVNLVSGN